MAAIGAILGAASKAAEQECIHNTLDDMKMRLANCAGRLAVDLKFDVNPDRLKAFPERGLDVSIDRDDQTTWGATIFLRYTDDGVEIAYATRKNTEAMDDPRHYSLHY